MVVLKKKAKFSVRKKVIEGLGEYFFGSKTKSFYIYERAFYKEFLKNQEKFVRYQKGSSKERMG